MKEKQKQNAAMPLRPVLRCFGAILELLVTLALLAPSICTVLLPEKGFFSLRFLKWEAGVCFAAAILILSLVCPLVKVEFEPSGLVTTGKLLLRIGAVSWLLHASIVLGGASVAAFGLFWEIPLVKWIFFPLGVLIACLGVYLGIAGRRETERIRRGNYVIELTELTDREHVEE